MNRLVLLAHHDADAEVKPYVRRHLAALRPLARRIELVSNSPLPAAEVASLGPLVDGVRLRPNTGFDFGMWKDAFAAADLRGVDALVLTNSSVIGPLTPLAPIFERMVGAGWDFWGMTESGQFRLHLQTYFLVFTPRVFGSLAFRSFFESVLPYRNKTNVIHAYELGLTAFLRESGFRGGAAFPVEDLPQRPLADLVVRGRLRSRGYERRKNPTLYFPDRLLAAGMPFVKTELLRAHARRARRLGLTAAVDTYLAVPDDARPGRDAPAAGRAVGKA